MSTKKQREILRQRRIEFDKTVAENRKKAEKKPKRGRPKKKESDAK